MHTKAGDLKNILHPSDPSGDTTAPGVAQKGATMTFGEWLAIRDAGDRTAAGDISRIKSVLKLTVKDLADVIGVTRQAIYGWKSGTELKAVNAAKLESLKDAADVIASAQVPASPLLFRRRLPSGQTLLEAISAGHGGREVATALVAILQEEARNRVDLTARFANRRPVSEVSPDDAPLIFDERG